jgi:hypothetical protein
MIMLFNKNQRKLITETLSDYNLVPYANNKIGFIPYNVFSFLGHGYQWHLQTWMNYSYPDDLNNYIHWFSIYDEYEVMTRIHFYYPVEHTEGNMIDIIIDASSFPLLKCQWIHGCTGLVKDKLMFLFYAVFCKDKILYLPSTEKHLKKKLSLIIKKCLIIAGATNV